MQSDRRELAFLEIHLKKNAVDRENMAMEGGCTLQAMENLMLLAILALCYDQHGVISQYLHIGRPFRSLQAHLFAFKATPIFPAALSLISPRLKVTSVNFGLLLSIAFMIDLYLLPP